MKPREAVDRGIQVERRYELYVPDPPGTARSSATALDRASASAPARVPSPGAYGCRANCPYLTVAWL